MDHLFTGEFPLAEEIIPGLPPAPERPARRENRDDRREHRHVNINLNRNTPELEEVVYDLILANSPITSNPETLNRDLRGMDRGTMSQFASRTRRRTEQLSNALMAKFGAVDATWTQLVFGALCPRETFDQFIESPDLFKFIIEHDEIADFSHIIQQ